jgi:tetratricopeptide (TPR) repeat protein
LILNVPFILNFRVLRCSEHIPPPQFLQHDVDPIMICLINYLGGFLRKDAQPARLLIQMLLLLLLALVQPLPAAASLEEKLNQVIDFMDQHNYAGALELLDELEELLPDPTRISQLHASAYLGRGYQFMGAGDFSAARHTFLEGRRYNADDLNLWQGEAMVLLKSGQYAEAVSILNQTLGLDPRSSSTYLLLGRAYYADGRMPEALDALSTSIALDGGKQATALRDKVSREWQIEKQMENEVSGHFHLGFVDDDQTAQLAKEAVKKLEEAYGELGSDLAYYPDVRVPVLLYSREDFSVVTRSPHWAGGIYDGKIRLPLSGMRQMTAPLEGLLYHEYTHVLVHFMADGQAPVWLNEGLAELAERRIYSAPMPHFRDAVASSQPIDWDTLAKPFSSLDTKLVPMAYEQSYSMVHFMVDRFGWHNMSELLRRLGDRQLWPEAVAETYTEYGLDWEGLINEWRREYPPI